MTIKLTALNDFGDWLNPMLVKELRQGLKTNVFVGVFVLVQIAMTLLVGFRLLSVGASDVAEAGQWLDGVLWTALGAAMLLIMPLRGLQAISDETKQNTMDLVQLTNIGAWRIVLGKWLSLIGQIVLLAVSVLPYAVLRYFFGGVDVVNDLMTLSGMLLASMVISALCLMLSTAPLITRSIMSGALAFLLITGGFGFAARASMLGMSGMGVAGSPFSLVAALATAVMSIGFILAVAASRIASAAENFAAVLRLLALGIVTVCLTAMVVGARTSDLWPVLAFAVGGWSIFEALTERSSELPSLYATWARKGLWMRLAGRMLYPGWATGLLFTAVMVPLLMLLPQTTRGAQPWSQIGMLALMLYFAALMPLPLLLLMRTAKQPGWIYMLIQLMSLLVYAVGRMLDSLRGNNDVAVAVIDSLTPTSALASASDGWLSSSSEVHWITVPVITFTLSAIACGWLFFKARKEFKRMTEHERNALAPQDAPTPPVSA